jgi:hypothetical protein
VAAPPGFQLRLNGFNQPPLLGLKASTVQILGLGDQESFTPVGFGIELPAV